MVLSSEVPRVAVVAFPHAPLSALVIVIFADKEIPALWLKMLDFA
jgi:hypothetical protein